MRVNKFGGSLDKPYLLFPLLLFPPFSFIPVLIAKFGFLQKRQGEHIIDVWILIPIIFRFILIFVMAQIGSVGGLALQAALVLGSIFVTNMIHVLTEERCKDVEGGFGGKIIKEMSDSMIEYAFATLVLFSTEFIPIIGEVLEGMRDIPFPFVGKISQVIDTAVWSIGLVTGYMMMNMYDTNYSTSDESCKGKISAIRIIVSIIAFAASIVYQFHGQLANIISNSI
jgi:hypothetical protein